jgi:hypothetical protein
MKREQLLSRLREAVEPQPWIEAAWVGGSDAFGRADERSDIDLQLLVPPERADEAFAIVEEALEHYGIAATWRVPEPAWHGHRQRFYQLRGLPETMMVDLCVMRPQGLAPFLDPVRHGQPVIWFDRVGALRPVPDETLGPRFRERIEQVRARYALLAHMPAKALARGHIIEAVDGYHKFLLGPLVEVLRHRHCPQRQDYGMRYLALDLPPEVVAELERLVLPAGRAELEAAISAARAWLGRELAAT